MFLLVFRCSSCSGVIKNTLWARPCLCPVFSRILGNSHDPGSLLEHIVATTGTKIIVGAHFYNGNRVAFGS
jgi:hypothetical protein